MKARVGLSAVAALLMSNPHVLPKTQKVVSGLPVTDVDGAGIEPAPDYVPPEKFVPGSNQAVSLDATVGPNTLVNSRDLCDDGGGITQSETSMAVSGGIVVVAFNDSRGFHCGERSVLGWAFSLDGGKTFTDGGGLPGGFGSWTRGDPWLAVGPDGSFYISGLQGRFDGTISISRGALAGNVIRWSDPAIVATHAGSDKEALAVDQITGAIYMVYTAGSRIELVRSEDSASTWSTPSILPPPGGLAAFPILDALGSLYVTWLSGWPTPNQTLVITRSDDGGETFTTPVTISSACPIEVSGFNRGQMPAFPSVAIDRSEGPFDGRLYVAFHSSCIAPGNPYLTRSDDRGQTWASPVAVNDDATTAVHFSPTVSVDSNGSVNVFFYDRRDDPGTSTTNVYYTRSTDSGATFAPNIRVTDVATTWGATSSDIAPNFGDYMTSLSIGTDVLITWADGRNGDPDAYFARVTP